MKEAKKRRVSALSDHLSKARLLLSACLIAGGLTWGAYAQTPIQYNYLATAGECEADVDKNGNADGWGTNQSGAPSGITNSIDKTYKISGVGSQKITINRSSGSAGSYWFIWLLPSSTLINPSVGMPLNFRINLRTQGFSNATYQLLVKSGNTTYDIVKPTSVSTNIWQSFSFVAPLKLRDNAPYFEVRIQVNLNEGAAAGQLWFDDARLLSSQSFIAPAQPPNNIKTVMFYESDWTKLLNTTFSMGVLLPAIGMAVRHHRPDFQVAINTASIYSINNTWSRYNTDLFDYTDCDQNNPSWFLLDANQNRLIHQTYTDRYVMDIGNPAVQERAWLSLQSYLDRAGRPKWVFFDNWGDAYYEERMMPHRYTRETWNQAITNYLAYLAPRMRSHSDSELLPNTGSRSGFWLRGSGGNEDGPGISWLPHVGGFVIEHAFTRYDNTNQTFIYHSYGNWRNRWTDNGWRHHLRAITENSTERVLVLPNVDPNNQQMIRYALASYLLAQTDNSMLLLRNRVDLGGYSTPLFPPEMFVPIGRPLSNYQILQGDLANGGLFFREYQYGVVLVNPTESNTYTYQTTKRYFNWDQQNVPNGTTITIPPKTGIVLYANSHINISLSPQEVRVNPGEAVNYTVTYQNIGLRPANNAKIEVPLPNGAHLVTSNPPATIVNGRLQWIIPTIAAGSTGTLTFRVELR